MRRSITLMLICLALLTSIIRWSIAWAQGSYNITRYTVESSGTSNSNSYKVSGTTGQAAASSISNGTFTVNGGYWRATIVEEGSQIFLPALER
jgi:hypothetical protein